MFGGASGGFMADWTKAKSDETPQMTQIIDQDGYRANVGIILKGPGTQLLWAKRVGQDAWQFPQGGMFENETPEETLYRELHEEIGLTPDAVKIIDQTKDWLRYRLPARLVRTNEKPVCIGQKQKWFLLSLEGEADSIHFDESASPEFDGWQWVSYWYPLRQVVAFKRDVYRQALQYFAPTVFGPPPDGGIDPLL